MLPFSVSFKPGEPAYAQVVYAAVRALVTRMERRETPAVCTRLATRLVVRESSTAVTF